MHGRRRIATQALRKREARPQRSHVGPGACAHDPRLFKTPTLIVRVPLGTTHSEPHYCYYYIPNTRHIPAREASHIHLWHLFREEPPQRRLPV